MSLNIGDILRNIFQPLPDPESEADKFLSCPLPQLPFSQMREFVRFILEEVKKSRKFGLIIEYEHIEKEELFFLSAIGALGGPAAMLRVVTYEKAQELISVDMWKHFRKELLYYFKLSNMEGRTVKNMYNCHLQCVRDRILHEIYNVPNRVFDTA